METAPYYKTLLLFSLAASPLAAQGIDPDASTAAARAALSVLSIAATPNETLSSFSSLIASGDTKDFRSTQFRGGFNPNESGLYLEGLVAYQNYNPTRIFPDIAPGTELDVTWASVAATVGVGWDFPLGNDWKIRPAGHLSLGHVTADAFLTGLPSPIGRQAADVVDGSLNAFGVGASLSVFREAQFGLWEAEYRFRQTYLEFFPVNEPQAGDARASSNQTTLSTRHWYPLEEVRLFDLPTRLVLDAGVVLYHGDGATVLGTDWLATAGVGIEIDTSRTGVPAIQAGRIMLNGVIADDFEGFSIGFGLSF